MDSENGQKMYQILDFDKKEKKWSMVKICEFRWFNEDLCIIEWAHVNFLLIVY